MSVKAGSFTPSGTGNITVNNLTFLPTRLFLRVGPTTSSVDTTSTARSDGWTTASNQSYDSIFEDSTGRYQQAGTDMCIRLFQRNGTTHVVEDNMAASFVDFHTNTPTNFGFTLNFSANVGNKQIRYMADDA